MTFQRKLLCCWKILECARSATKMHTRLDPIFLYSFNDPLFNTKQQYRYSDSPRATSILSTNSTPSECTLYEELLNRGIFKNCLDDLLDDPFLVEQLFIGS